MDDPSETGADAPLVVVGGDAAGLSAASKYRREADDDAEVVVFEKGRWISYAHCGEPYFVGGYVDELTDLLSLSPDDVADRGIDLRRGHEVVAVDPDERVVTVAGPDGATTTQAYGSLLVATGARAAAGPFDLDRAGAYTVHGLDDAAAIDAHLSAPDAYDPARLGDGPVDRERVDHAAALPAAETAAVVGGGYVGVELCEALVERGVDVHLFQRSDRLLPPFGEAAAEAAAETLRDQGVTVHLGTTVETIAGDERVTAVVADGERIAVDLAIVGVGIEPNADFLDGTGVDRDGDSGAVVTDDYGRTSVPDVYAAGDAATARHVVTDERAWVPLGLTANRHGRAIGQTVAGDPTPTGGVAGTAVLKAFDLECGRTGLTDPEAARAAGFDPETVTITAGSRSGYYPGNAETTVTLVADRDSGRLLGGSIAGTDRAAVRIDTVATAVEAGLTIPEVERLDLKYAPPFSPVWEPVLVAAKVLNGRLDVDADRDGRRVADWADPN